MSRRRKGLSACDRTLSLYTGRTLAEDPDSRDGTPPQTPLRVVLMEAELVRTAHRYDVIRERGDECVDVRQLIEQLSIFDIEGVAV